MSIPFISCTSVSALCPCSPPPPQIKLKKKQKKGTGRGDGSPIMEAIVWHSESRSKPYYPNIFTCKCSLQSHWSGLRPLASATLSMQGLTGTPLGYPNFWATAPQCRTSEENRISVVKQMRLRTGYCPENGKCIIPRRVLGHRSSRDFIEGSTAESCSQGLGRVKRTSRG